MVELISGLVDQVETEQRRLLTKIVRHGNPPVDHLFFCIGLWVIFIFISLISDDGDHAVVLAGFYQLTQMNQPRFGRFCCHPNTHVGNAFRAEIADHQRVKLADTALGARPVDIKTHAKLLRVMRGGQRRLSGNGPAGSNQ